MKHFLNLKLFSLLCGSRIDGEPAISAIQLAYEEFASVIYEKIGEKTNLAELYYELGFTRLELMGLLRSCRPTGEGKKCPGFYNESNRPY